MDYREFTADLRSFVRELQQVAADTGASLSDVLTVADLMVSLDWTEERSRMNERLDRTMKRLHPDYEDDGDEPTPTRN